LIVSHDPACSLNARDYKGPLPEADLSTGVAYAIQERAMATNPASGPDGAGVRSDDMAYTLEARTTPQAVAFDMRGGEGGAQMEGPHETANLRAAGGGSSRSYIAESIVRRLTPVECERLQGFPDGYTDIPWPRLNDGHRYKALGNSMAVPVVRWIGERIQRVDRGEDLWT
jgi:DNA (cytosine-5)-methyltransferase 1